MLRRPQFDVRNDSFYDLKSISCNLYFRVIFQLLAIFIQEFIILEVKVPPK